MTRHPRVTETKKQRPNTGARANNTLHTLLGYPIGEPVRQSACKARPWARHGPLARIRGSGCRRRAGARLLLAGDNTFEDGLGIIHYCRLGDLLRVVCDE